MLAFENDSQYIKNETKKKIDFKFKILKLIKLYNLIIQTGKLHVKKYLDIILPRRLQMIFSSISQLNVLNKSVKWEIKIMNILAHRFFFNQYKSSYINNSITTVAQCRFVHKETKLTHVMDNLYTVITKFDKAVSIKCGSDSLIWTVPTILFNICTWITTMSISIIVYDRKTRTHCK